MGTKKHTEDCNWEKTTPEQCEYKTTHHYCPHPEHACNCDGFKEKAEKIQVEIVKATGHELSADKSIFFTIDPQFAGYIDAITTEVAKLVGHNNVVGAPIPRGAVEFYQIEHPYIIGVDLAKPGADESVVS